MPDRVDVVAPARANLIGNPSDIYGGRVLSVSVPLFARVELRAAHETILESAGGTLAVRGPPDLELRGDDFDLGRAALRDFDPLPVCHVRYASEIPQQSGLGGSTALLVALLRALLAWREEPADAVALVQRARKVERGVLGIACGWIDFYMSVLGGVQYVDFAGLEVERPRGTAPAARAESLSGSASGLPFVLALTGVRHHSGAVHRPIRERWEAGEPEVVSAYRRVSEIAREGRRAYLSRDWPTFGARMNENHAIQRDLGGSGESNERLIQAALDAGAPGAKLAGAGDGGTIVALWPDEDVAALEASLERAGAAAVYRPRSVPGVRVVGDNGGAGC